MIILIIDNDRAAETWTDADVEARLIAAMKLDRLAPKLRGPKVPGNNHPTVEYTREERDEWEIVEKRDVSREPLLRDETVFMDSALEWLSFLSAESEGTRRTFVAWLRGKAAGHGAMKKWCAEHGVLNGSVAHARKRCVAAIVARLNAERAAKMQVPNPGRFAKALRRAA